MRNSTLFSMMAIAALGVALASNSNGVAHQQNKDRTGAPGSDNTCQQCHAGGAFQSEVQAFFVADGGVAMEGQYVPGETYMLTVNVAATGAPAGYGVHGTVVFPDGSNAGTLTDQDPNDCIWLDEVDGRHIFEQNDLCASPMFEVEWTAPAPGSGPVEVYVASVTANGNGVSSGDTFAGGSFTFEELAVNAVEETVDAGIRMWSVATGTLVLEGAEEGKARVLSLDGRVLWEGSTGWGRTELAMAHQGLVAVQWQSVSGLMVTRKVWVQ